MATYKVKRKLLNDDPSQQKRGMGTGTKALIGATAVAGGLVGARYGLFGHNVQRSLGNGMMNVGMVKSGAKTISEANLAKHNKFLSSNGAKIIEGDAAKAYLKKSQEGLIKSHEFLKSDAGKKAIEESKKKAAEKAKAKAEALAARVQARYGAAAT